MQVFNFVLLFLRTRYGAQGTLSLAPAYMEALLQSKHNSETNACELQQHVTACKALTSDEIRHF